jgi:hypothetical protein
MGRRVARKWTVMGTKKWRKDEYERTDIVVLTL